MKNLRSIFIILFLLIVLAGCKGNVEVAQNVNANTESEETAVSTVLPVDKLEVYYFHRTARCVSCMTIGEYISKTMLENYADEMANGKIDYREINVDLPENKELATKFKASGSSLFLNAIRGEKDEIQNVIEVWTLKSNEANFKNFLKQKIDNLLFK